MKTKVKEMTSLDMRGMFLLDTTVFSDQTQEVRFGNTVSEAFIDEAYVDVLQANTKEGYAYFESLINDNRDIGITTILVAPKLHIKLCVFKGKKEKSYVEVEDGVKATRYGVLSDDFNKALDWAKQEYINNKEYILQPV